MKFVNVNGIKIHYLVQGSGPHLLLFAPGAFNSVIGNWTAKEGKYAWKEMDGIKALSEHFTVIAYDRREAGLSGGRIEALTWDHYVQEAKGLLDALAVPTAYVLGGCMGASLVGAFASRHPELCKGLILHWPVGGYRWMLRGRSIFDRHATFVRTNGLAGVVERAQGKGNFWADPESGPWAAPIAHNPDFAEDYMKQDIDQYLEIVGKCRDNLFNSPLPSGASLPDLANIELPAIIMSGKDEVHTVSSAWTMHELMPKSKLWDVVPPDQNGENILEEILRFKARVEAGDKY